MTGAAAWLGWMFDGLDMHLYTLVAAPFVMQLVGAASTADVAASVHSLDRDIAGSLSFCAEGRHGLLERPSRAIPGGGVDAEAHLPCHGASGVRGCARWGTCGRRSVAEPGV